MVKIYDVNDTMAEKISARQEAFHVQKNLYL
jgi:hypothetical protein